MKPLELLKKSSSIAHFEEGLRKNESIVVEGLFPTAKACIIAYAAHVTRRNILVLTGTGHEEYTLFSDLPFFSSHKVVELQAWETLPQENIAPSPDIVGARFSSFNEIIHAKEPLIVLSALQAALQKMLPQEEFEKKLLLLKRGTTVPFERLLETLQQFGYEKRAICSDKGEYAVRGGIIDIFPVTMPEPFRLEFWGDEIDSMRLFDPVTQKSSRTIDSAVVTLAKELEFVRDKEKLQTLFDYLKDPLIILDDIEALEDRYASLTTLAQQPIQSFMSIEELFTTIHNKQKLFFTNSPLEKLSQVTTKSRSASQYAITSKPEEVSFEMFQRSFAALRWTHPFETLGHYFERECLLSAEPEHEEMFNAVLQLEHDADFLFVVQNDQEEESLKTKLREHSIISPHIHILKGYLTSGFALKDIRTLFFPMTEYTHRKKVRREPLRTYYQSPVQDAFDMSPGELVVHFNHGIGKYLGVEKKANAQGEEQEFFVIEYAERAKLYVPLPQAHLISKYIGSTEEAPKLHVLGTNRWKKLRQETEKAIIGYAAELLKLYATRELHGGFSCPPDGTEIKLFEEQFPYIETQDQLTAIADIKKDMHSAKAMDRLILGDVGYGKTEVAMRAAFKAVRDGKKQVAILAPTTVLAMQHYETFLDRMEGFDVRIAPLSRFLKAKEQKAVLAKLAEGSIDIIIGTHRLLQQDVHFKDLGLIVIDEEQRFGVKAKDHLKRLKASSDCLALSATPIPRTLYMSLVGARDLSVIATPPQDRLPIKTIVAEYDETLVQTALLRELNREGQVYFIHNRVESIFSMAEKLQALLPRARIVIAHGQMDPHDIEVVFHAFKRGDADILVATSIVENGIDIPNANTLIINNADQFGIADLYQLRGRVGRWNRRAYAYFLTAKRKLLSEISRKRLDTIAQAGGYGGGMKVAMRDLEMRGAGDIIGTEQSGHVATIGFHLYCKLLKRTIDSMQGKAPSWTIETRVELPFDARLPEHYVNEVTLRMEMYQRLGDAISQAEVDAIWEEILDRFGKPPEQATALYHMSRLRVFAAQQGFTHLKLEDTTLFCEKKSGERLAQNRIPIGKFSSPQDLVSKIEKALVKA